MLFVDSHLEIFNILPCFIMFYWFTSRHIYQKHLLSYNNRDFKQTLQRRQGWLTRNNRILHRKQRTFIILRPWRILHAVLVQSRCSWHFYVFMTTLAFRTQLLFGSSIFEGEKYGGRMCNTQINISAHKQMFQSINKLAKTLRKTSIR